MYERKVRTNLLGQGVYILLLFILHSDTPQSGSHFGTYDSTVEMTSLPLRRKTTDPLHSANGSPGSVCKPILLAAGLGVVECRVKLNLVDSAVLL